MVWFMQFFMQRRFRVDPEEKLSEYINFVVENLAIDKLTTEQISRELSIFTMTLLSVKTKVAKVAA